MTYNTYTHFHAIHTHLPRYTHTYTQPHIHKHLYIYTHTQSSIHTGTLIHKHTYKHTLIQLNTQAQRHHHTHLQYNHTYTHTQPYTITHTHMHIHTHTITPTHTHTHTITHTHTYQDNMGHSLNHRTAALLGCPTHWGKYRDLLLSTNLQKQQLISRLSVKNPKQTTIITSAVVVQWWSNSLKVGRRWVQILTLSSDQVSWLLKL